MITNHRFLRLNQVRELTGLPTSTLYDLMQKSRFPRPIKLSARSVAWLACDIEEWQERLIQQGSKAL
ncbi:AlpA family phage regulatory protein [Rhizobiales bacterium RZME27]|uniref:AlpA family phage regulatory protein n=1 Tax=Endobacterium cereale TaxID=2663029 RepID=A0A6A8A7S2_9HYPH|nr:AlpA family transcriptional regulator [Endobacterium cereale]MQY45948.1 AlpA family phage regulatory protein [Endobacterium cereale]